MMPKNIFLIVLLGFTLTVGSSGVAASQNPQEILESSLKAQLHLSWTGVSRVEAFQEGENVILVTQIVHQPQLFHFVKYLEPSMLRGRIIFDDGVYARNYVPGKNKLSISPSFNSLEAGKKQIENLALLLKNYQVSASPGGALLNRPVIKISLDPLYPGNPRMVIWVDEETHFPLKRERYSAEGKLINVTTFMSLEFPNQVDSQKLMEGLSLKLKEKPLPPQSLALTMEEVKKQAKFDVSLPRYLPPGYSVRETRLLEEGKLVKLTYTNGLGVVCLFQRPRAHVKMRYYSRVKFGQMGAQFREKGISRTLVWTRENITYVLIGDISRDELNRIALSIE